MHIQGNRQLSCKSKFKKMINNGKKSTPEMAATILKDKAILSDQAYFETVQARKRLSVSLQETLNNAFPKIPVSFFPEVPGGKAIEIPGDASMADTVLILSENNIMSAPIQNPGADDTTIWYDRCLSLVDYSTIILWVLENADLAAVVLATGSVVVTGMGVGAVSALGALALGATGPAAVAGLTIGAVGAAVAGGIVVEKGIGKDASTAAGYLGDDFYKIILQEESFKSTTIQTIVRSSRWTPFLPVQPNDSMLTVLLLLSKYRLRSVPVIEIDKSSIKNMITQSAVIQGLAQCRGRDWFDIIARKSVSEIGLPFMSPDKVICIGGDELVLGAFKCMHEKQIGGLPVVQGPAKKIIGNISIRDIQFLLLHRELFSKFRQLTALDFMRTVVSTINSSFMMPPITCKSDTPLGDVIEVLAEKGIHRIHLVDEQDELCGVITSRDVISCFVSEPEHYCENHFELLLNAI